MQLPSDKSLGEVNESIDITTKKTSWRRFMAFLGPAYLVSVGYMDPGNWATDIAGGSQFGYQLVWVLLMSNLMALLLQSLSARLGVVRRRDLAQCNRETYPKGINFILYILAEIAIAACDLAEVLGMAIGLNLLFGIPLLWGVLITFADTILLLYLQHLGMRKMEAFIIGLVAVIGGCFLFEMIFAKPDLAAISKGFIPSIPNHTALYIAIGIIGATVMPHNLYLHSALVQTRKIKRDKENIRKAIRFNILDSTIALNAAFFVNAAILILAGTVFYQSGNQQVASLEDAHQLLAPLLGNQWASHLFAIALIAAGQSSTVTGTLAGQIVMEGYLRLRINPWMRRLLTRLLAIIPAVIVILIYGDNEVDSMLVFSQVLLSIQLAFAVIPLIHFVSDKAKMGDFAIGAVTKIAAWLVATIIVLLNLKLVHESALSGIDATHHTWVKILIITGEIGLVVLLLVTTAYPILIKRKLSHEHIHNEPNIKLMDITPTLPFNNIAIALDYSEKDNLALRYALQLAHPKTSFILIHIVESASAKVQGADTDDHETQQDKKILKRYADVLQQHGHNTTLQLGYRNRTTAIASIVKEQQADLLILGSHGHMGLHDFIMGETINRVRHLVDIPIFIAK